MENLNFTNFTIRLRDWYDGEFIVEVVTSPVGRMSTPDVVYFNSDILPYVEMLANPKEEEEIGTDELIEMGEMLAEMLFPPTVRRMLQKSLEHILRTDGIPSPPIAIHG